MPPPPKRPTKKRPGSAQLAARRQLQRSPEEREKEAVFANKDAWGYRFAQPIWRLDLGVSETMKRAPEDKERERLGRMLDRLFGLPLARITAGMDGEELPWGVMKDDHKKTSRRVFAESVRLMSHKAAGGVLGSRQTYYLAHAAKLMHTFRIKARAMAFPLELEIEESVLKSQWLAEYALQVHRAFYPIFKAPKKSRFELPLVVTSAYRVLDGRGESAVRTNDRKAVLAVEAVPVISPNDPFKWKITAGPAFYTLKEPASTRSPAFILEDTSGQVVGECTSSKDPDSHSIDATFRFDIDSEQTPWLGLSVLYLDAFTQRARGVLGRAAEHADDAARNDEKAAQNTIDDAEI
jgi:hypothetical protein